MDREDMIAYILAAYKQMREPDPIRESTLRGMDLRALKKAHASIAARLLAHCEFRAKLAEKEAAETLGPPVSERNWKGDCGGGKRIIRKPGGLS